MSETTLGNFVYHIKGDASGLKSAVKDSETSVKGLFDKVKGFGKLAIFGFAISEIFAFGKELVNAAADAARVEKKFNATFSGIQKEAHAMALGMAESFGFTEDAVMEVVQKTGYMLQSMGLSEKASLDLSASVYRLAVDMKAFAGGEATIAGAAEALTRALAGQTRGLREYGIMLSPERLKQFAEQMGVNLEYASAERKAAITLMAIQESAITVNGAYAKSMYGYGNQMMISKMLTNELHETMGKNLLPIAGLLARAFNNIQLEAIHSAKAISDWIGQAENIANLAGWVGNLAGAWAVLSSGVKASFSEINIIFLSLGRGIYSVGSAISRTLIELDNWGKSADDMSGKTDKLEGSISPLGVAFTILLMPIQLLKASFRTVAATIDLIVNSIIGLGGVLKATAIVLYEWFKAVKSGNFDEYNKSLTKLGETTWAYGQTLSKSMGNLTDTAWNNVANFKKESEQMALSIMSLFGKSKAEAEEMVNKAFKAKNQDALKKIISDAAKVNEDAKKAEIALELLLAKASGDATTQIVADYKEKLRAWEETAKKGGLAPEKLKQGLKALEQMQTFEILKEKVTSFNNTIQSVGGAVSGLMSGIAAMGAATLKAAIDSLEGQKQAAYAAAGVSEETAVQTAQKEYDEAVKGKDKILIHDKKMALDKAKIDENYAKKKAQLEYKAAMQAYEWNIAIVTMQSIMAIMSAVSAGMQWGGYAAIAGVAILGGMATAAAAVNIANAVAAKPQPPALASGGIIPGSMQGTTIIAGEGGQTEAVLNQRQLKRAMDIFDGKESGSGGGNQFYQLPPMSADSLWNMIFKASQDGLLFISKRAVMA